MKPEERARVKIDQMFDDAGWKVVDREYYTPTISAVAIREGLLENNLEADYLLFLNGKAVGVLEAKREETNILRDEVCAQAGRYARILPSWKYQAYMRPLPFIYQSNGNTVIFKDMRSESSEYIELNRIHSPKEIVKCWVSRMNLPVCRH